MGQTVTASEGVEAQAGAFEGKLEGEICPDARSAYLGGS
jgi:hypothetical protein